MTCVVLYQLLFYIIANCEGRYTGEYYFQLDKVKIAWDNVIQIMSRRTGHTKRGMLQ